VQLAGSAFAQIGFEENSFAHDDIAVLTQVRKTPRWPRSYPNFSRF
jgi:hypothetical protein